MARIEKNVLFLRTTYKKDVDLVGEIKMKYTFSRAGQLLVTFLEEKAFLFHHVIFMNFLLIIIYMYARATAVLMILVKEHTFLRY